MGKVYPHFSSLLDPVPWKAELLEVTFPLELCQLSWKQGLRQAFPSCSFAQSAFRDEGTVRQGTELVIGG